jgi:hypothetical protein
MKAGIGIVALGLLMTIGASSCDKDDQTTNFARPMKADMTRGTWGIGTFEQNGLEIGDHYKTYVFTFNSDGKVQADAGGRITEGHWSQGMTADHESMLIDFGDVPDLNLLNNTDWKIISQNFKTMHLSGERGDDGSSELEFRMK